MSDKSTVEIIFLNQFLKLMDDLILIQPKEHDFKVFKDLLETMQKNKQQKTIVEQFIIYVYPHHEMIKKKDEQFFLNEKIIQKESEKTGENKDFVMKKFFKIRNIWHTLSEENKETIWNYFNIFIKLATKWYQLANTS